MNFRIINQKIGTIFWIINQKIGINFWIISFFVVILRSKLGCYDKERIEPPHRGQAIPR